MIRPAAIIACTMSVALCSFALAHDFWVQPAPFRAAVDALVKVHLHVGHAGEIDDLKRNPEKIDKFIIAGPEGVKDVAGKDGEAPAGFVRAEKPGLHVIGYRSKHSFIELKAEEFEGYLRDEGLDKTIATRKTRGESQAPGKEIYSRCAKAMLLVGDQPPADNDRSLGFRLELMAQKNPMSLKPGDELPVQLLFEGKPLEGVLVKLKDPTSVTEEPLASARTDADGKVSLKLDAAGVRIITAVHMIEAPKDNSHGAQWESLWASLSFEIHDRQ